MDKNRTNVLAVYGGSMILDIAKIAAISVCAIATLILFLFFADGFISAMNNPTMCESMAKTFVELARCP